MGAAEGVSYVLAGDTSSTEDLLVSRTPNEVSPRPTVYLPTHDPESVTRLAK